MGSRATSEDTTTTDKARRPRTPRRRLAAAAALVTLAVAALVGVGGASAMVRAISGATHAAAAATPLPSSVQLYQWETSPSGGWITGNLGDHNASYAEGQVIPFRLDVSDIAPGSYSFAVCRDFSDGGSPATYGYLRIDPFETDYTTDAGSTSSSGAFSYTGGISSLSGSDTGAQGGCPADHVETDVSFTTDGSSDQFVYWGGYLAAPLDTVPAPGSGTVTFQHSAGFYPGSSLHMLLLSPGKDRSINPGSIIRLAEITATKVVDSGSAHPDAWCFTIDSGPESGSCKTPNLDLAGSDGLNDSYRFLALPGGTYHVTESTATGYEFDHGVNTLNCPFTGSTAVPVVTASTAGTTNATCEFHNKLSKTSPSVSTTLKNAAGNGTVADGSTLPLNSSVYDTASVTAGDGLPLTGTVTFEFYGNATCTGSASSTQTGVAIGTASSTKGPLTPGSYGFRAMYVAGSDANHVDSGWSACEPFSIAKGTPSTGTTLKNAAGNATIAEGSALPIGSSVYDTASVNAGDALPLTGTITFEFYGNATCTGTASSTQTGVAVGTASSAQGPLATGSYGFRAMYVAGSDPNHADSGWSACEPFSVSTGTPSTSTTLKNADGDATVAEGTTLPINSSVYDTASVTAGDGLPLTGTVSFEFYANATCTGTAQAAQAGVAVGTASSARGPLGAGSYGFRAMYVAGSDPNHANSAWSACEPFSIGKGAVAASTTLKNAAGDATIADGTTLAINSSVYDTASVSAGDGLPLTGTVSFQFFVNATCSGSAQSAQTGVAVGTASSTKGPLAAGSYGFRAMYVAGSDPNHADSAWSACEPFSIGKGIPSAGTTLKNADGDATVTDGSALPIGSSVYDTASISAGDGLPLTGTVTFEFYANATCSSSAQSSQSGVALGTASSTKGPLPTGSYGFRARYVAGSDPNHADSDWSACEPFSIGTGTPSATTTLKNADGDTTVADGTALPIGSSLYDTASIVAEDGLDLTGTVSFEFFHNSACTGDAADTQTGAAVGSSSTTEGPLPAGSYGFRARYIAGNDPNHVDSDWSACEPFSIDKGTPSASTTLKNADGDATVADGSTLPIDSSVYDTANVSADDELDLTGTVSFQFFQGAACTGEGSTQSDVALGSPSDPTGALGAGDYSFRAKYVAGNDPNHVDSDWSACEPFSIGKATPALATTPSAGGTLGVTVHDTATLSGAVRPGGTITFTLYRPSDTTCTGTAVFTSTKGVTGNGDVDSDSYTPGADGTYRWVARYSGDANNAVATSACGAELVTIDKPATPPPPPPPAAPPAPPAPTIDLAITKSGSPDPASLGNRVTWTMVVTNNGPSSATGVTVGDPVPAGTTFVSATSTQGTCAGGAVVTCQIGSLAAGASATITLVTTANATGTLTNTATAVGKEQETNTANNTATAKVTVKGAFVPPVVYCTAVAVTPKSLFVGRANKLTLKISQHGKRKAGVKIRIRGASIRIVTKPSNAKGIVKRTIKPTKAGIVTFSPLAAKSCKNPRVGVIGVFTPPVTG